MSGLSAEHATVEDSAWRDFLAQELQDLARTRPAIMDADLETLKAIMEARYTLLLADAGIHGDSILSSVDENAAGYRRRILVRFYCPGEVRETPMQVVLMIICLRSTSPRS